MGSLGGGGDLLSIHRDGGDSQLYFGLQLSLLCGEHQQLGLAPYKFDLVLVAVKLGEVKEGFQSFKRGCEQTYVVSLCDCTQHLPNHTTSRGHNKAKLNTKLRLLSCLDLLIVHQSVD